MIGQAGTLESNDIMITVSAPEEGAGIFIDLESVVLAQYEEHIRAAITKAVQDKGLESLDVKAVDRGALDSTIRARVFTAIARAEL